MCSRCTSPSCCHGSGACGGTKPDGSPGEVSNAIGRRKTYPGADVHEALDPKKMFHQRQSRCLAGIGATSVPRHDGQPAVAQAASEAEAAPPGLRGFSTIPASTRGRSAASVSLAASVLSASSAPSVLSMPPPAPPPLMSPTLSASIKDKMHVPFEVRSTPPSIDAVGSLPRSSPVCQSQRHSSHRGGRMDAGIKFDGLMGGSSSSGDFGGLGEYHETRVDGDGLASPGELFMSVFPSVVPAAGASAAGTQGDGWSGTTAMSITTKSPEVLNEAWRLPQPRNGHLPTSSNAIEVNQYGKELWHQPHTAHSSRGEVSGGDFDVGIRALRGHGSGMTHPVSSSGDSGCSRDRSEPTTRGMRASEGSRPGRNELPPNSVAAALLDSQAPAKGTKASMASTGSATSVARVDSCSLTSTSGTAGGDSSPGQRDISEKKNGDRQNSSQERVEASVPRSAPVPSTTWAQFTGFNISMSHVPDTPVRRHARSQEQSGGGVSDSIVSVSAAPPPISKALGAQSSSISSRGGRASAEQAGEEDIGGPSMMGGSVGSVGRGGRGSDTMSGDSDENDRSKGCDNNPTHSLATLPGNTPNLTSDRDSASDGYSERPSFRRRKRPEGGKEASGGSKMSKRRAFSSATGLGR